MNHNSYKIKRLTAVAMFCALSYVCMLFVKIPVQFLTLDVKDSLIILCSLLFGPISGIAVAIIVPFLELITISGTGVYGFIMNVLSSVVFSSVAGVIYYYRKSMVGAVIGLITGVCAVTAVMLLANLLITPYYLGGSPKDVAAMIPTVLLPFNLVKATLNAAIVLLLYKPISTVLKKMGFLKTSTSQGQTSAKSPLRSVIVTSASILIIVASLLIVFFVLKK